LSTNISLGPPTMISMRLILINDMSSEISHSEYVTWQVDVRVSTFWRSLAPQIISNKKGSWSLDV